MLHSNKNINKEELKKYYMEHFQRGDVIIGTVVGYDDERYYVIDDATGKRVAYYGTGMVGNRVELAVKRVDFEKGNVTCNLSAVLEFADFVA